MKAREQLRPEVLARERRLAARRLRRQNAAIAALGAAALPIALCIAWQSGGAPWMFASLGLYLASIPLVAAALWFGCHLWWGIDMTLRDFVLRVAVMNAVIAVPFLMPGLMLLWYASAMLVLPLFIVFLRGFFDIEKTESVLPAVALYLCAVAAAVVVWYVRVWA
jgi:hypothetical protein